MKIFFGSVALGKCCPDCIANGVFGQRDDTHIIYKRNNAHFIICHHRYLSFCHKMAVYRQKYRS